MPQTRVRVVGSGFTTLHFNGQPISFLDSFRDSGAKPIGGGGAGGAGWEPITPLGKHHPVEIATSRVLGPGTITASIRELWNQPIWFGLHGVAKRHNLVNLWAAMARDPAPITCQMIIKPPNGVGPRRRKVFHGCVITDVDNGETVEIGTLSVSKSITIVYTHATHDGGRGDNNGATRAGDGAEDLI